MRCWSSLTPQCGEDLAPKSIPRNDQAVMSAIYFPFDTFFCRCVVVVVVVVVVIGRRRRSLLKRSFTWLVVAISRWTTTAALTTSTPLDTIHTRSTSNQSASIPESTNPKNSLYDIRPNF